MSKIKFLITTIFMSIFLTTTTAQATSNKGMRDLEWYYRNGEDKNSEKEQERRRLLNGSLKYLEDNYLNIKYCYYYISSIYKSICEYMDKFYENDKEGKKEYDLDKIKFNLKNYRCKTEETQYIQKIIREECCYSIEYGFELDRNVLGKTTEMIDEILNYSYKEISSRGKGDVYDIYQNMREDKSGLSSFGKAVEYIEGINKYFAEINAKYKFIKDFLKTIKDIVDGELKFFPKEEFEKMRLYYDVESCIDKINKIDFLYYFLEMKQTDKDNKDIYIMDCIGKCIETIESQRNKIEKIKFKLKKYGKDSENENYNIKKINDSIKNFESKANFFENKLIYNKLTNKEISNSQKQEVKSIYYKEYIENMFKKLKDIAKRLDIYINKISELFKDQNKDIKEEELEKIIEYLEILLNIEEEYVSYITEYPFDSKKYNFSKEDKKYQELLSKIDLCIYEIDGVLYNWADDVEKEKYFKKHLVLKKINIMNLIKQEFYDCYKEINRFLNYDGDFKFKEYYLDKDKFTETEDIKENYEQICSKLDLIKKEEIIEKYNEIGKSFNAIAKEMRKGNTVYGQKMRDYAGGIGDEQIVTLIDDIANKKELGYGIEKFIKSYGKNKGDITMDDSIKAIIDKINVDRDDSNYPGLFKVYKTTIKMAKLINNILKKIENYKYDIGYNIKNIEKEFEELKKYKK